ncbi:hypothetical protein HYU07_03930 [Candidatus Woesearchaeota archaeon]|nr:hypothetical protein [Candidatus Woesearchaeota archaeon]
MDKIKLIKATFQAVETLCERVHNAGITSSMTEGTYHHEIAYGLDIPLAAAKSYFRNVVNTIENPEVGKEYGIFKPFQMAKAIRATKAAKVAIDSLPLEQIQEVHDAAQAALSGDLEGSVAHYANALSHKRGQKIAGEDVAKMQPVMKSMEAAITYCKLQEMYKPAF